MTRRQSRVMVRQPFTPEQVASLNEYQASGIWHPFTCRNRGQLHPNLVADTNGWHCTKCDFKQDWAHPFMVDGSWRQGSAAMLARHHSGPKYPKMGSGAE
jgi:hypothetical protein